MVYISYVFCEPVTVQYTGQTGHGKGPISRKRRDARAFGHLLTSFIYVSKPLTLSG